ncbi:MAG: hypothetical protein PUF08_07235 [Clostridiales bacterium]|nr:hypothetical protein [Clostridiales bacterium]
MEEKEFKSQYKKDFDGILASESLRNSVKNLTPRRQRHTVTPFKATIGTVAAAVMIFAAVHEYKFEQKSDGVISETVVTTPIPEAQFGTAEPSPKEQPSEQPKKVAGVKPTETAKKKVETTKKTQATNSPQAPIVVTTPTPQSTAIDVDEPAAVTQKSEAANDSDVSVASVYAEESPRVRSVSANTTETSYITTPSGGDVSVTKSNEELFDVSLSGTVVAVGEDYQGYKVSGDIYYKVYAVNATYDEVIEIVNGL